MAQLDNHEYWDESPLRTSDLPAWALVSEGSGMVGSEVCTENVTEEEGTGHKIMDSLKIPAEGYALLRPTCVEGKGSFI